jgi:hypothetical protein
MEKSKTLNVLTKIYRPFKITKKNSVYIFNTMEGNFVVKESPKIDYKELYKYLLSRSFNYIPNLSLDSRDDVVVFEYCEDYDIDCNQKILDMIYIVGLLHSKTSYYKDVTIDKYKEIYENIKNNLLYVENYYDKAFNEYLESYYNSPSEYLFLRSYSIIYGAFRYCYDTLDSWFKIVSSNLRERVCLIHNNLKLEHFIRNNDSYLISWDNYIVDTLVLDLFKLYKEEWDNVSFLEVIESYNSVNQMLEEERMLFDLLISIPYVVHLDGDEFEVCYNLKRLVTYLEKTSKLVLRD